MKRATEIALAQEILDLRDANSAYLDEAMGSSPVSHYFDAARFEQERERIFHTQPIPLVHSSELSEPNDFLRRELAGLPLLITRDADGEARAFLNVCRHRGTRLVDEHTGCKKRFSCPYHAWTWDNRGKLLGIPQKELGFAELDKDKLGLKQLGCVEKYGWVWVCANQNEPIDIDAWLGELAQDLQWIDTASHRIVHSDERVCHANWKLLVEGGIEAYHFVVAHRNTIGPYFHTNLSTYRSFGSSTRSVLARKSIDTLKEIPEEQWQLREHAQLLYSFFPSNAFLVQADHLAWIQMLPIDAEKTQLRVSLLAPEDRLSAHEDLEHWQKNHDITLKTLNEDFDIAESIQSGLKSGANSSVTFGRFEGALKAFNEQVESML